MSTAQAGVHDVNEGTLRWLGGVDTSIPSSMSLTSTRFRGDEPLDLRQDAPDDQDLAERAPWRSGLPAAARTLLALVALPERARAPADPPARTEGRFGRTRLPRVSRAWLPPRRRHVHDAIGQQRRAGRHEHGHSTYSGTWCARAGAPKSDRRQPSVRSGFRSMSRPACARGGGYPTAGGSSCPRASRARVP